MKHEQSKFGKLPPQAVEVEESILGAAMLERDAIHTVLDILDPLDFYKSQHQILLNAIQTLFATGEPVDIKTVVHQLRADGKLDQVGGAVAVSELTTKVNSAANIEKHCRIVKEQSIKRGIIRLTAEYQEKSYDDTFDVFELLDTLSSELYKLNYSINSRQVVNLGDAKNIMHLVDHIANAKSRRENNEVIGVPTGFRGVDHLLGGLRGGDLIIIAARPAMGKTAFIASCMKNQAMELNIPVAMFSLEMTWGEIGNRLICLSSEVGVQAARNGTISSVEFERIMNIGADKMSGSQILIDDTPGMTIQQMRAKAVRLKQQYDIKILYVDYMQLASGSGKVKGGNREQEIAEISRGLKSIAKDLNIPVIALSQLSRAVETRGGDKRPQLSDLRESGSIEQDADAVIFLYRPEYYGFTQTEDGTSLQGIGQAIIAKSRHGAIDDVTLRFRGKFTEWADPDPVFASEWTPDDDNLF